MTDQQSEAQAYCEVCGIDVKQEAELKRFGKFFCSQDHMEQYVRAKQGQLGMDGERRRFRRGC